MIAETAAKKPHAKEPGWIVAWNRIDEPGVFHRHNTDEVPSRAKNGKCIDCKEEVPKDTRVAYKLMIMGTKHDDARMYQYI